MYALAAVLGTPLVAFKERNFLAARGNFSWTTLSTVRNATNHEDTISYPLQFCRWFEQDARSLLPPQVQELEHFMWHKIRGFIWYQYQEQSTEAHAFMFKDLVRDIISRASMCMKRLSYDKCMTPLLAVSRSLRPLRHYLTVFQVLPIRVRGGSAMNGPAMLDGRASSEGRLSEVLADVITTPTRKIENDPQSPTPTTGSVENTLALSPRLKTPPHPPSPSPAAEQLAFRQQLLREYGSAPKAAVGASGTRKRANSVDAAASRPGDSKRLRTLAAPTGKPKDANTDELKVPAFSAQGSDRDIILVVDDDETGDHEDDGTWFDSDGPKKEPSAQVSGEQGGVTNGIPKPDDTATKPRTSKQVGDKKSQKDTEKPAPGAPAKKTTEKQRPKSKSSRKPKATPKPKRAVSDNDSEDSDFEPEDTTAEDTESESNGDLEGPWQGPINLEPFDGGFGLPDEEDMDEEFALIHDKIFPSGGACTDGFWKRRVRVSPPYNMRRIHAHNVFRARNSLFSPIATSQHVLSRLERMPSETSKRSRS